MRSTTIAAPALMLGYGVLRWVDGLDGTRHNGPAWTAGHIMFFLGIVLFTVQAFGLARLARDRPGVAVPALTATVVGAACFLWVIAGDLFRSFDHPLWPWLNGPGPALFVIGMVTLLGIQAVRRRVPYWSPAVFLLGFLAVDIDLDLLPWASTLILIASVPVARGLFAAPRPEPLT